MLIKYFTILFFFSCASTSVIPTPVPPLHPVIIQDTTIKVVYDTVYEPLIVLPLLSQDTTDETFGAKHDGASNDTKPLQAYANWCFGDSINFHGNAHPEKNHVFILHAGIYLTTAPVKFWHVHGGSIIGAGRGTTTIYNNTSSIFVTNGMEFSIVAGIEFKSSNQAHVLFDLDWDNSKGGALQSNTFFDNYFEGGSVGSRIGVSGFMGSENYFLNDFWEWCTKGLQTCNFNALSNTIDGGNAQGCGIGFDFLAGQGDIRFTGCQANGWDVSIENSANDIYSFFRIRSESQNFLYSTNHAQAKIELCNQLCSLKGHFAYSIQGSVTNSISQRGDVVLTDRLTINNFWPGDTSWLNRQFYSGPIDTINIHTGYLPNGGGELNP